MAGHTEPTQQHTKAELMHPGNDNHVSAPPCPDPSVHRDTKLQEQASSAALYVTRNKSSSQKEQNVLDANNKLSSRSAAQSLKYAKPEDLPSFPVVGINTTGSANAAANLANTNQKPFEHWKPDASADAGKAAMLAKDYKMAPLWKPELSAAGSKAALLAHRDGGKLDLWMPQASAEGNSAATIALSQKSTSPQLDYGYTDDGRKRALMAATGAISRSKSQKETPAPVINPAYPDSKNSAHNALNAATVANKPSVRRAPQDSNAIDSDAMRAARVQNIGSNMDRQMFTERPPVEIELEEKRNQAALRASAVSMAKQMYASQEQKRKEDEALAHYTSVGTSAATAVHGRTSSSATAPPDMRQQALQYIHLQEAAQKLAQERLAKLDPDGVALYKAHYGYQHEAPRNRMSLRGRPRRRADSESTAPQTNPDDSSDDEMTSRRIRNQMSGLNTSVAEVDAKKRANDRAALLAAAERKVQAQMNSMDEKVFQETGQVSPALMEQWEAKARARATADSVDRQKNYGKVNIGGGRYMEQHELDAIAQARLQPTLNEIGETAERKRAADEERRLEEEENRRQFQSEKERLKEVKAEEKRLKAEEKAEAKAKKNEAKAAEKARKAEEKAAKEEDKRRSREAKKEAANAATVSAAAHEETVAEPTTTEAETGTEREIADTTGTVPEAEALAVTRTNDSSATGKISLPGGAMRPELDRHASTVLTSSSEGSSISSFDDSDIEEDAAGERAGEHEDRTAAIASAGTGVAATPVTATPVADHTAAREIAERATEPAATTVGEETKPTVTTGDVVAATPITTAQTTTAERPTTAETAASATSPTSPTTAGERRKSRGFTGFFGKFKRNSKAQIPAGAAAGTTTAAATTTTPATGNTTTSATAAAAPAVDDDSDAESESSFRRHEADLHSLSSLSSTSSDAEDARRGRSGKASTVGGPTATSTGHEEIPFTTSHSAQPPVLDLGHAAGGQHMDVARDEDEDDEEGEFEEARDHFDDGGLAVPAGTASGAAGAERKSAEHETRFKEEL